MIPLKHFRGNDYLAVGNPDEEAMLLLLNEKVQSNPEYVLPLGYKKVQDVVIEDSYKVPDAIEMPESEKIALEVLDQIFAEGLGGVHILQSVP